MPPRRQTFSAAELAQFVAQGVADALAAQEAQRNSGTDPHQGSEDTTTNTPPAKPCTYKDFLSCKPLNFKGTEGAIGLLRWFEKMESVFRIYNCTEECKVKFSTCTLMDGALTWWNTYAQTVGIDVAYQLPWEDLKKMMKDEYCPREELQQLEVEFWNLTIKGDDITGYTNRFNQLALLCPTMVDPEYKRIERYIWGLPARIQGMVTASSPGTIQSAIRMAHNLMAQVVRRGTTAGKDAGNRGGDNKRKYNNHQDQQQNKKPETARAYTAGTEGNKGYNGSKPFCSKCNRHHDGSCPCSKCKRFGHLAKDCRTTAPTTNPNTSRACFESGDTGHFKND